MTKLFKGGQVVNVFTCEIEKTNILERDGRIIGVGDYEDADEIIDVTGKYLCPGFIDGHIHIESTMLMPAQFAKAVVPHGTSAVIADPHEIVNVCGKDGISYMLEASKNLPMDVFIAIPSYLFFGYLNFISKPVNTVNQPSIICFFDYFIYNACVFKVILFSSPPFIE